MNRFGSFRNAAVVVVLGGLVAAAVAVATASAAPSKKNYTMKVWVTNDAVSHQDFTVKITNDPSSNTTLGSANITLPTGFTADNASTTQTGWSNLTSIVTDSNGTSTVQLRSDASTNALAIGASMTAFVHVSSPTLPRTGCNATWSSTAKQSNNYLGTNNWFTQLGAPASDLTPLGSFKWDPIGTVVSGVFAPAILTGVTSKPTVDAYDTCGALKTDYNGPTSLTYNGHSATVTGPTWSGGIGTAAIKPTVAETSRALTLTDIQTSISAASDPFDTQDKICTVADTSCTWHNGNNSINATAKGPATGSLGVGFDPSANVNFSCSSPGDPLGSTVLTISPHGTPDAPYQVTVTYSKALSGNGPASGFIFCLSTDQGQTFNPLPACTVPPANPPVDCIVSQKRVTGGALQFVLSLLPGDPYGAGK